MEKYAKNAMTTFHIRFYRLIQLVVVGSGQFFCPINCDGFCKKNE